MSGSWDLRLRVDAHGHEDTHVRLWPPRSPEPHVMVRVGTVSVHCLDATSTMTAGLAWATARLSARSWLPDLADEPVRRAPDRQFGGAFPIGSLVFDGRQPFNVVPQRDHLSVVVGPLQVNVYDFGALDTHVRAWTQATALATRAFGTRAVPFGRLMDHARREVLREVDEHADRRGRPGRAPRERN